ncbi:MAG: DUF1800 domain-containing protein, partial [Proteobacteria bacterium]|nr:DUF1800 domain-containing protein [Pseudomonadota bacterium]
MQDIAPYLATNRFGLGGLADAPELRRDPRGWLMRQITPEAATPAALAAFPGSDSILSAIQEARRASDKALMKETRRQYQKRFLAEVVARARHAVATETPFAERMVLFWSNHFTASRTRALIGPGLPAYEREAIRPRVFGRFEDLLLGVTRHVCMLAYLDNVVSVGPNSLRGRRRRVTLNENLAREILELHTLGVNGGYTQADVVEFARALTGWTWGGLRGRNDPRPVHGTFEFVEAMHEPGPKTVLGVTYREDGVNEAIAILRDLARHPSTAQFLATKLARHFVADEPPAEAIAHIARRFRDSGGDLAQVSRTLVELDAAWQSPLAKVKTHYEFLISTLRTIGIAGLPPHALLKPLRELGQEPFNAPSPAGW